MKIIKSEDVEETLSSTSVPVFTLLD